jgi:hypothetical protein
VIHPAPKPVVIRSEEYQDFVRGLPCLICGAPGEPHHVRHRRGFGDAHNIVPLCHHHHRKGHDMGWKSWERAHCLKLAPVARLLWAAWEKARD